MRSNNYQEKLVICITHASMRMQFSLDPSPREGARSGARTGLKITMRHETYFSSNTPRCKYPYINDILYRIEISFSQQIQKFLRIFRQFLRIFRQFLVLKFPPFRIFIHNIQSRISGKNLGSEFPIGYSIS